MSVVRAIWGRLLDWLIGPETEVPHYENWDGEYWG
jgi:hypothetical protein